MSENAATKGRKKRVLDLSLLADADSINEPAAEAFFATCSLCGSTKKIARFKGKSICAKCIYQIKEIALR